MGQYYKVIILDGDNIVLTWLCPYSFSGGAKLMEHAYMDDALVKAVEQLIRPGGDYYKKQLVWAGDYADCEANAGANLYSLVETMQQLQSWPPIGAKDDDAAVSVHDGDSLRYIVNHTKHVYVDKQHPLNQIRDDQWNVIVHPLPLLVSESGGGDYCGNNEGLCGTWARDSISVEHGIPDGYTELVPNFYT